MRRFMRLWFLLPAVLVVWTVIVLAWPRATSSCPPSGFWCSGDSAAYAAFASFAVWVIGVGVIALVAAVVVGVVSVRRGR
jgi:hypothetical protein